MFGVYVLTAKEVFKGKNHNAESLKITVSVVIQGKAITICLSKIQLSRLGQGTLGHELGNCPQSGIFTTCNWWLSAFL